MKVVILAGGFGTRLSEETDLRPKPMVEIGGKPILWHIMKNYSEQGYNEFVVCLGYMGYYIKEWFSNYCIHNNDVTFDLSNSDVHFHNNHNEKWKVTLIDTGANTMTGGRIKRIKEYTNREPFMATYGDGLSDIDLKALIGFHKKNKRIATLTATIPEGRFGALKINSTDRVEAFSEKTDNQSWINGGFFIFEPAIFDYLEGDDTVLEKDPMERLAQDDQLDAYKHCGFWKPMDKLVDKKELEKLWQSGNAPWKNWK
jgi:glucose-1-phosphate cytidylyltransferase